MPHPSSKFSQVDPEVAWEVAVSLDRMVRIVPCQGTQTVLKQTATRLRELVVEEGRRKALVEGR